MAKKNILISTGPTRVYIDPVRYISNASSGKMGLAFTRAALKFANVCTISANLSLRHPKNVKIINVSTNDEMFKAVKNNIDWADIFISVAAIVDFEPLTKKPQKIKKSDTALTLQLKNSTDILKFFASKKRDDQIMIGFALETENLLKNAEKKLREKNLDFIVANRLEESIGLETASATLLGKNGIKTIFDKMDKTTLAEKILEKIIC